MRNVSQVFNLDRKHIGNVIDCRTKTKKAFKLKKEVKSNVFL